MLKYIAFVSALLPLALSPNLVTMTAGHSVFIRALAFGVLLATTITFFNKRNNSERKNLQLALSSLVRQPVFIASIAYIVLLLIGSYFAYNPSDAFFGEPTRSEGFLTLFAFFIVMAGMAISFSKKIWLRYFATTIVVSLVVFIVEMKQVFSGVDRPDAIVGNATFLAGYMLYIFTSALYLISVGKKEGKSGFVNLGYVAVIVSLLGMLLTKTRASVVALGVALVAILILVLIKRSAFQSAVRKTAGIALAAIVLLGGLFLATKHSSFWQHVPGVNRLATTSLTEGSAASRLAFSKVSINGFFTDTTAKELLLGWGTDNFGYFYEQHYDRSVFEFETQLADRAHNKLIDVLVMSGILGLIAYLAIWLFALRSSLRTMKTDAWPMLTITFFLVAYFVNNLFVFDVPVTYLGFFSVLALVLSSSMHTAVQGEVTTTNRSIVVRSIMLPILTLFAGVALVVWTFIPNLQVRALGSGFKKLARGADVSVITKNSFIFSPTTYVQPSLRYVFLSNIPVINAAGRSDLAAALAPFAVEKMEEVLPYTKPTLNTYLKLARAYDIMGVATKNESERTSLWEKAGAYYEKALALVPEHQSTLIAYATNIFNRGDEEKAISMIREALHGDQNVPALHYALAQFLALQNGAKQPIAKEREALKEFEIALSVNINPYPQLTLAVYKKFLSDFTAAGDTVTVATIKNRLQTLEMK